MWSYKSASNYYKSFRPYTMGFHQMHFTDSILEIVPGLFLVLFRTGTTSVRSGRATFFVPEAEHAKHFLCF